MFEFNRPITTDHPLIGQEVCMSCPLPGGHEFDPMSPGIHPSYASSKSNQLRLPCTSTISLQGLGFDASAFYYNHPMMMHGLPSTPDVSSPFLAPGLLGHSLPFDPNMTPHPYGLRFPGMEGGMGPIGKTATRETTGPLKVWLGKHKKNPYPTKAEKIMLSIITKMTLTQVSTWFANARRRLKKDRKHHNSDSPRENCDKDDDGEDDDEEEDNDIDVDDSSHTYNEDDKNLSSDRDHQNDNDNDEEEDDNGASWTSNPQAIPRDGKCLRTDSPDCSYRKQCNDDNSWSTHLQRLHNFHHQSAAVTSHVTPHATPLRWTSSLARFSPNFDSNNTHIETSPFYHINSRHNNISTHPKPAPSQFVSGLDTNYTPNILDLSSKKDTQRYDNTLVVPHVPQTRLTPTHSISSPDLALDNTTTPSPRSEKSSKSISNTTIEYKNSPPLQESKSKIWSISEIIKEDSKDKERDRNIKGNTCDFS